MELYKGFELYIDLDSKWYWRNPYIDAPVEGMLSANSKQDIKTIVENTSKYLSKTGMLIIEHGYNQAKKVRQIFTHNKFNQIEQHKDINNKIRATLGFKI